MLPARQAALSRALEKIDAPGRGDAEREVRVTLLTGEVVEGLLMFHAEKGLSIQDRREELVFVESDEIQTLEVGVRRTMREFVVVSGMILGVTALLVLEWNIPFLRAHLSLPWVATQLAIFSWAGLGLLKRRTALGRWLRSWKATYDNDRSIGEDR